MSYLPDRDASTAKSPWIRHGRVPDGEGVLTMAVDTVRHRAFLLSWPSGRFTVAQLSSSSTTSELFLPPLMEYPGLFRGECVHPRTGQYRCVCRSMVGCPEYNSRKPIIRCIPSLRSFFIEGCCAPYRTCLLDQCGR